MRAPDRILGDDPARPYLSRWYLTPWSRYERDPGKRTRWDRFKASLPHVYLHHIHRSDDDRALHDHPWWNISIVLKGGYFEWAPLFPSFYMADLKARGYASTESHWRGPGSVIFRKAVALHRLEIPKGSPDGAWTLFITGPRVREWGFACPQGWRHWQLFTDKDNSGAVGRGCGD